MAQKTVRILKPWGFHPIGAEITTDDSVAELLLQRKAAELVTAAPAENAEPVVAAPPAQTQKSKPSKAAK